MIVNIDGHSFKAVFEDSLSPKTCHSFRRNMPFESKVVHVRWSGEAMWIPLGNRDFEVAYEEATTYPTPGQILLFPQGKSETEILVAYGSTRFASKAGTLAGNHFATIVTDLDKLREIGMSTMWEGAKPILFELEADD